MNEIELCIRLGNSSCVSSGIYYMDEKDTTNRYHVRDVHKYFATNSVGLEAFLTEVDEFGWDGPVVVLPEAAALYCGSVFVDYEDCACREMRSYVKSCAERKECYKIRVFVASKNGFGCLHGKELREALENGNDDAQLTWWIFFHLDENGSGHQGAECEEIERLNYMCAQMNPADDDSSYEYSGSETDDEI